jgi:hypothetical protein
VTRLALCHTEALFLSSALVILGVYLDAREGHFRAVAYQKRPALELVAVQLDDLAQLGVDLGLGPAPASASDPQVLSQPSQPR